MGLGQEEEEEAWAETPRHVKPKSFRRWNDGEGEDDALEPVRSEQRFLEDEGGKASLLEAADGPCAGTDGPALAAADGAQEECWPKVERSRRAEGGRVKAVSEETESPADGATPVRAARAQVEAAQIPDAAERFWNGVRRSARMPTLADSCRSEAPRGPTSSQKPSMPVSCLWSTRRPLPDAVAFVPDKLVPGPCMSASSPSLRGNQAIRGLRGLPPGGSPSSWERLPSVTGPALRNPTPRTSSRDFAGAAGAMTTPPAPGRCSSIQADYWACVLPDSLPPSPDRSSPLWNPNQEYEALLDFTYPLKPGPRGPKPLEGAAPPDHVLHDSGVDLDSFSLSPESSLRSPGTSAHHHPGLAPGLSPSAPGRPGSVGLTASGCQGPSRASLKCPRHPPPAARRLELSSPAPGRLQGDGAGGEEGVGPEKPRRRPQVPAGASAWATQEGSDSEEEYLSLPPRLTQVSSLERYLAAAPGASPEPARQSGVGGAGPDWADSGEGRGGKPCGALRTSGPHPDHLQLFREDVVMRGQGQQDPANQWERLVFSSSSSLPSSQPFSPLRDVLEGVSCLFTEKEQQQLQQDRNRVKGPLVWRIKTFCSQLEGLIHWLYRVAEMSDNLIPPKSNISSLRSSLQQYRQFRRDIAEHQSLTEDVLQKGESLLACMVENTPVLKSALGLISRQTGRLEEHAERLYDSVLATMDTMDDPDPVAKGNPASLNGTAAEIWTGEEPVLVGSPSGNPFMSTDQAGDE
ncbi:centrosomal protein of 68 kDa [Tachyglossus aculeatus]|uniref:centrosomal protein of 68 kDa n=1 Tax=Tachyglossus aculeatus TaxID=9261 RepID=UPI0018F5D912|nr:centrosomal protein of 68 kDa [Tachyglossus aculeatus]